jgi:hypothetical protein
VLATGPNWAETVMAIGTAVGALGLLGAIGAAVFAAQQVREARQTRQAHLAGDFLRRWSEADLVETRRLVAQFPDKERLRDALEGYVAANAAEAYILNRELDYFEQLAALEERRAIDFELIRSLLGRRLIERWDLWKPSIDALGGESVYPMFDALVSKMRRSLSDARAEGPPDPSARTSA